MATAAKPKSEDKVTYEDNGTFTTQDGQNFQSAHLAWEHAHELDAPSE